MMSHFISMKLQTIYHFLRSDLRHTKSFFFQHISSTATAAILKHNKELPTGKYIVPVDITDLQGQGKTQMVPVRICECRSGACLAQDRSTSLGSMGLLAMLLPLVLLLLLCEYPPATLPPAEWFRAALCR